MEQWAPYDRTREELWGLLDGSRNEEGRSEEEKRTLLMDYEMAVILAAYSMGLQDRKHNFEENPQEILKLLNEFSPLARTEPQPEEPEE